MPVVDDAFGSAGIITKAERLQRGVVPGRLAADSDGRLALSIGDGEVLVPVSGSCGTAQSGSVGTATKLRGCRGHPHLDKPRRFNNALSGGCSRRSCGEIPPGDRGGDLTAPEPRRGDAGVFPGRFAEPP